MIHYIDLRRAFMDAMKMIDRTKYRNDDRLSELDKLVESLWEQMHFEAPSTSSNADKIHFLRNRRHELLRQYVAVERVAKQTETNRIASLLDTVNNKLFELTGNRIYSTNKIEQAI